jgi:predicted nuclease with TOPRIM domain
MAQQMRVRDQEIIVKKVVNAIEENGLQDLKTRFGNDSDVKFIEEEVKKFNILEETVSELKNQIETLQKSIRRGVEDYNTAHNFTETTGLHADTGRYSRTINKSKPYFEFKLNWNKKTEIADSLALQTLGSDFNVQDLIAKLVAEFS